MVNYSASDVIKNIYSYILTKLFFKNARLVRRPIYMSGKKGICYGEGFTTGHGCRIDASPKKVSLQIGDNARIGDYVHINANERVQIGDNVLIASKVFISDANHGCYSGFNPSSPYTNPNDRDIVTMPVNIGDNVWIGENVVILPGTTIGNGCIIGANSVVTGDIFPDNVIIVGSPARIIKQYDQNINQWVKYKN